MGTQEGTIVFYILLCISRAILSCLVFGQERENVLYSWVDSNFLATIVNALRCRSGTTWGLGLRYDRANFFPKKNPHLKL